MAKSTCAMPFVAKLILRQEENRTSYLRNMPCWLSGKYIRNNSTLMLKSMLVRVVGTWTSLASPSTINPCPVPSSTLRSFSIIMPRNLSNGALVLTSTCPRWNTILRLVCGTISSPFPSPISASHRTLSVRQSSSRPSPLHSRWRKSYSSSVIIPRVSIVDGMFCMTS